MKYNAQGLKLKGKKYKPKFVPVVPEELNLLFYYRLN